MQALVHPTACSTHCSSETLLTGGRKQTGSRFGSAPGFAVWSLVLGLWPWVFGYFFRVWYLRSHNKDLRPKSQDQIRKTKALINRNPQPIRALVERQTQHAGDHQIEVESDNAVQEVGWNVAHKRESERRCHQRDDHASNLAGNLN